MRVRRIVGAVAAGAALSATVAAAAAAPASALPRWTAPITVSKVRGIPEPRVAMDRDGLATIVYADASPTALGEGPGVFSVIRRPRGMLSKPRRLGDGGRARIAVGPDGTTAVAWVAGNRIELRLQGPPPASGGSASVARSVPAGGAGVDQLELALDGAGRATAVWTVPTAGDDPLARNVRAVTVAADGAVGAVEQVDAPATCARLSLDASWAGDVAAICSSSELAYVRDAGAAAFAAVPHGLPRSTTQDVAVDGAGTVVASSQLWNSSPSRVHSSRPRGGAFGPPVHLHGVVSIFGQEQRTVAAWRDERGIAFATRPAGGGPFGGGGAVAIPKRASGGIVPVVARSGPLPLLTGVEPSPFTPPLGRLAGATVEPAGGARATGTPAVPGAIDHVGGLAGDAHGRALFVWEQRCGEGWAVMAMALDDARGTAEPPCQDGRAPRALVRPRRARLVGDALRFRVGCDERCRVVVRARVLRDGRGRPLATKRIAPRTVAAGRFRSYRARLRPAEAARVRAALAAGRRVAVRFALSVRDDYENGAVRRVAVPLRR